MDSKTIDYYLEDLTESGYNTKLIKNKREIHANVCFHVRKKNSVILWILNGENSSILSLSEM